MVSFMSEVVSGFNPSDTFGSDTFGSARANASPSTQAMHSEALGVAKYV